MGGGPAAGGTPELISLEAGHVQAFNHLDKGDTFRGLVTRPAAAILDIDGTLVDTNYQHAVAWFRAFRRLGLTLPLYRVHRHIGMGGDQRSEHSRAKNSIPRTATRCGRSRGTSTWI